MGTLPLKPQFPEPEQIHRHDGTGRQTIDDTAVPLPLTAIGYLGRDAKVQAKLGMEIPRHASAASCVAPCVPAVALCAGHHAERLRFRHH